MTGSDLGLVSLFRIGDRIYGPCTVFLCWCY